MPDPQAQVDAKERWVKNSHSKGMTYVRQTWSINAKKDLNWARLVATVREMNKQQKWRLPGKYFQEAKFLGCQFEGHFEIFNKIFKIVIHFFNHGNEN